MEFLKIKKKIESLKSNKNQLKGELNILMNNLKDLGIASIKEGKEKVKALKKNLTEINIKKEEKQNGLQQKLEKIN